MKFSKQEPENGVVIDQPEEVAQPIFVFKKELEENFVGVQDSRTGISFLPLYILRLWLRMPCDYG